MAALLEQGADALASSPAAIDETATWGADPSRVRAVAAERPPDVRIVAGSAEPPITVLPSTLVADLRGLLRFPAAVGGGGDGGLWPRLFQSVALRVAAAGAGEGEEEGEQEAASTSDAEASYTVWAHRSWIARRCPYFGRALASGACVGGWRVMGLIEGLQVLGFVRQHACLHTNPHTTCTSKLSQGCARRRTAPSRLGTSAPRYSAPCSSTSTRSVSIVGVLCYAIGLVSLRTHQPHHIPPTKQPQDTLQTTAAGEEEEGGTHDEDEDEDEAESLLFPLLVLAHRLGLDSLVALCEGYIREVWRWSGGVWCHIFLFCGPVMRKPAFIHTHTPAYTKQTTRRSTRGTASTSCNTPTSSPSPTSAPWRWPRSRGALISWGSGRGPPGRRSGCPRTCWRR